MRKGRKKLGRWIVVFVLALATFDLMATILFSRHVLGEIEKHQMPEQADVALIFFKAFEETELSLETKRNLEHAQDLYKRQRIQHLICVGGARPKQQQFGAKRMKEYLVGIGVPADKISFETTSYDSVSNLRQGLRLAKSQGAQSIVLISSAPHVFRLRWLTKQIASSALQVTVSFPLRSPFDSVAEASRWWQSIHHEFAAWIAWFALPTDFYRRTLAQIRGQQASTDEQQIIVEPAK